MLGSVPYVPHARIRFSGCGQRQVGVLQSRQCSKQTLALAQACKVAGGEQAFRDGLLPQLVPLFTCPIALRAAYGNAFHSEAASAPGGSSSVTAGGAAQAAAGKVTTQDAGGDEDGDAGGDAGHADNGYWDLVYILYPEAVETAGLEEAHDFVPGWEPLEHALKVRNLNPLALHRLAMQEARCAELEDYARTAQCCYWRSHEGQVW